MQGPTNSKGPRLPSEPPLENNATSTPELTASATPPASSTFPAFPVTVAEALAGADESPMAQLEFACRLVAEGEFRMKQGENLADHGHGARVEGLALQERGEADWLLGNRMYDEGDDMKRRGEAARDRLLTRLLGGGTQ